MWVGHGHREKCAWLSPLLCFSRAANNQAVSGVHDGRPCFSLLRLNLKQESFPDFLEFPSNGLCWETKLPEFVHAFIDLLSNSYEQPFPSQSFICLTKPDAPDPKPALMEAGGSCPPAPLFQGLTRILLRNPLGFPTYAKSFKIPSVPVEFQTYPCKRCRRRGCRRPSSHT